MYIERAAELLGIGVVLCSRMGVDGDGRVTGGLIGGNCRGPAKIRQPKREVGNSDVVFEIFTEDGGKLGELGISRGGVRWWPKGAKTRRMDLSWEQFRDRIENSRR